MDLIKRPEDIEHGTSRCIPADDRSLSTPAQLKRQWGLWDNKGLERL